MTTVCYLDGRIYDESVAREICGYMIDKVYMKIGGVSYYSHELRDHDIVICCNDKISTICIHVIDTSEMVRISNVRVLMIDDIDAEIGENIALAFTMTPEQRQIEHILEDEKNQRIHSEIEEQERTGYINSVRRWRRVDIGEDISVLYSNGNHIIGREHYYGDSHNTITETCLSVKSDIMKRKFYYDRNGVLWELEDGIHHCVHEPKPESSLERNERLYAKLLRYKQMVIDRMSLYGEK